LRKPQLLDLKYLTIKFTHETPLLYRDAGCYQPARVVSFSLMLFLIMLLSLFYACRLLPTDRREKVRDYYLAFPLYFF
ncbi:MAG: hypothetical protein QMB24_01415, partial [Spirosomataceae bacterium]